MLLYKQRADYVVNQDPDGGPLHSSWSSRQQQISTFSAWRLCADMDCPAIYKTKTVQAISKEHASLSGRLRRLYK